MTRSRSWLKAVHRTHTALTVLVVATVLVLNRAGVIDGGQALALFLLLELPVLAVFVTISILRFRRLGSTNGTSASGLFDRLVAEEPLLRPAIAELRTIGSLMLAVRRKRKVPQNAVWFGYTKGTMTLPAVMIGLSLVELVIVHLLVPWAWLRLVLLVLTIWGMLFFLGYVASRIVHPHYISGEVLHLRWGLGVVLATPLANVASVVPHANHAHTQPGIEGNRLILTQFQSTNVRIRFAEPVATSAPVSGKHRPADSPATEVQLYVDDPDAFVRALRTLPDEVRT